MSPNKNALKINNIKRYKLHATLYLIWLRSRDTISRTQYYVERIARPGQRLRSGSHEGQYENYFQNIFKSIFIRQNQSTNAYSMQSDFSADSLYLKAMASGF